MLKLIIQSTEQYDEDKNEFITPKERTLQLEHSLVSLSKWESKWHKPFLSKEAKTFEESVDYISCMTITQNVDPDIYNFVTSEHIKKVGEYIEATMTATTISKEPKSMSREIITAEIIYYWMISFNIPMECQKWHLDRLLMLINVCNAKNATPKKIGKNELASRNAALNAARRKAHNTTG